MNRTRITRDPDRAVLTIERRFDAPRSRVWHAYTDPDMLDRWWAPQPWKTVTVGMDFRPGGYWHYAMNGPDGEQHFGRMDFVSIDPEDRYVAVDVFADDAGIANPDLPKQTFTTTFTEEGATTLVVVVVDYECVADLQKVIDMGMEQGVTMAQDQLETLLAAS